MIDITAWMDGFLKALNKDFGNRVWFVGLQGSYGRGEATDTSDIDMVVILDELSISDIEEYNAMLDTLPHRELICGFLSGKDELRSWEPSDLFQFYYDTTPIKGSLDELLEHSLPGSTEEEIRGVILSVDGVSSPHHLRTRRIGYKYVIDVHIRMDGGITLDEAHGRTSVVEQRLKERFGAGTIVSIHAEPKKSTEHPLS